MKTDPPPEPLRPRDLALLLLASGDLLPRRRARDQQADLAGMELKRHVLDRLAALDPEPGDIDATLLRIVEENGPPQGPARAIAASIRDEWRAACATPEWVAQLLADAANQSATESEGRGRGRRVPQ
jgi:hypothetical protein